MNWGRGYTKFIYPKDLIFRGEYEIVDYQFIDRVHIAVLLPGQAFIVDQLTESVISACTNFSVPQRTLILSPLFECNFLPLIIC